MTNNNTDGGYYAIKGFAYQIDKAILELLDTDNENDNINIEQIQDIDLNDSVIQVKYKETAKLVPSQVNKPISQLIQEFRSDKTRKYILYAYFNDLNGYDDKVNEKKQISQNTLNELLGSLQSNFTNQEKQDFVTSFYLDFSPEFQTQFNTIISKLQECNFIGRTDEEAIFYYANISDYLYKLVVNNPTENLQNRSCTQKEVFAYLKNAQGLIFNSSFREFQGDQKYFTFIKKQHFSQRNIDYFERFVLVEVSENESISDIKEAVFKIINKFYNKSGTYFFQKIKSPAPYVFLKNMSDENLIQLKAEFLHEGVIFKDGIDFSGAEFSLDSIKQESTIHNNLCLKFVNNEDIFIRLTDEKLKHKKEVFQFFINNSVEIESDVKNLTIQIKAISDINSIL